MVMEDDSNCSVCNEGWGICFCKKHLEERDERNIQKGIAKILQIMNDIYRERRKHRGSCKLWEQGKQCPQCGFGFQSFIEDVVTESMKRSDKK